MAQSGTASRSRQTIGGRGADHGRGRYDERQRIAEEVLRPPDLSDP